LEELTLNDRKVCRQFSPGAKLVGNAPIAQCNDGPGLPAPPSSSAWTTVAEKLSRFFLAEARYKKLTNGLRACGIVAERFLQGFLRGQNKTTREPPFLCRRKGRGKILKMRAKEKLTELFMLRLNPVDKRGLKLTRNAWACL
jgi:hypothetical protein